MVNYQRKEAYTAPATPVRKLGGHPHTGAQHVGPPQHITDLAPGGAAMHAAHLHPYPER